MIIITRIINAIRKILGGGPGPFRPK